MVRLELAAVDRRMAIAGAVAGAAGLALPRRLSSTVNQRGMVGGGLARFEQGEANFSLITSRMQFAGDDSEVIVGTILWVDDQAGLTLKSIAVTDYVVPEQEGPGPRRIIGTMSVNGEGEYPFWLEVVDADPPGSGTDTANLMVGDTAQSGGYSNSASDSEFSYMANATVVTGDLQDLDIEIDPATGAVRTVED